MVKEGRIGLEKYRIKERKRLNFHLQFRHESWEKLKRLLEKDNMSKKDFEEMKGELLKELKRI